MLLSGIMDAAAVVWFRHDLRLADNPAQAVGEGNMKSWGSLAVLVLFVAICMGVAAVGGLFTASSVRDWYPLLRKPSFNPPAWVFGPVWTALYLMMAVAAWLVWRRREFGNVSAALWLFAIQLALNAAWSPLFFGLRNPLAGLLDIVPLCLAILLTLISFWKISALAGMLLAPYWLWVCFATVLNFAIWSLNR